MRLDIGAIVHLLDLPIADQLQGGADEAWRLQSAIDFRGGQPPALRVARIQDGARFDFSPVPALEPAKDQSALTLNADAGLFHNIPREEVDDEVVFYRTMLWMKHEPDEG